MNLADFHRRRVLGERVELEELNQRYRDQGGLPDAILLFIDLVYLQLISSFVTFFEFSLSLSYWICNRLTAFTLLVYFWFTVYFFYFFLFQITFYMKESWFPSKRSYWWASGTRGTEPKRWVTRCYFTFHRSSIFALHFFTFYIFRVFSISQLTEFPTNFLILCWYISGSRYFFLRQITLHERNFKIIIKVKLKTR